MRFLTEVASDPGLEPGALRLGGARSYPTELIRQIFIFYSICLKKSMILRGSNKRNLTIQKLLKAIENYVKTMLKWFLSQYAAFFIASGRTLGKDKYLYPLNYGNL